jgi:hypothetical protein
MMATKLTLTDPKGLVYSAIHRTEAQALEVLAWSVVRTPGCTVTMEPCELPARFEESMEEYVARGGYID